MTTSIPEVEQDPKRRLHDTINSLNRNQKHRLIRFIGAKAAKMGLLVGSRNG